MRKEQFPIEKKRDPEEGENIMLAACFQCAWEKEELFIIGDDERTMARHNLEDAHTATGCSNKILIFSENHERKFKLPESN